MFRYRRAGGISAGCQAYMFSFCAFGQALATCSPVVNCNDAGTFSFGAAGLLIAFLAQL
jgi:hypothetical protein